jgi:hypothetical protein
VVPRTSWELQHAGLAVAIRNEAHSMPAVPRNPAKATINCGKAMANWAVHDQIRIFRTV